MIDLLLTNGTIYTLHPSRPRATALGIRDGRIIAFDDDARARQTAQTETLDLRGRVVIPGITDYHIHFTAYAMSKTRVLLDGARSLEEVVARVAARVKTAQPGEWIFGLRWNQLDWTVPNFPTKEPLDAIAPNNPVVLKRQDGHSAWVNSAALRAKNISRDTPDQAGGVIDRDANGEPTGTLRENAMDLLGAQGGFAPADISEEILLGALRAANKLGLTGIHNVEGASSLRAFQNLRAKDKLTLRVAHTVPSESLDRALELGLRGGFGDDWLRIVGVKIFSDGALGSQTAWMLEPFEGQPNNRGVATHSMDEIERLARAAGQAWMAVYTHAIGDRANREVLNVYEKLRGEKITAPFRIEHAQHLDRADIPRFAALNVIASMQPIHATSDYKMADQLVGARGRYSYAFKSLLNAGAALAFGSDCPVETLDPWVGIHAAVTRERANGEPTGGWYPEEKLTIEETLRAYCNPLSQNARADCIMLSQDIFAVPPREILQTRVETTIVSGKVICDF